MSYAYKNNCDDDKVKYPCELCPQIEKGRIRGFMFIQEGVTVTDYSDATEIANLVDLGDIYLVPNTTGSLTVTEVEQPGVGNTDVEIAGYDFVLEGMDRNVYNSCEEAITIAGNKKMRVAYVTETLIWPSTQTVSVALKAPVEEDLKSIMNWNYTVKWFEQNPICPQTAPENTFDRCITVV